ncbi:hypothetical protein N4G62_13200 [Sphingomonas sanguinis]|uniref:Uncharacterized protein n=1 Tax=Sphingomonas sanguinis TaxID=33051 RepID=A0ABU5LST7_9SPHN|nr:hypothetical protein [Sphingomonas sanguinis]MDZ7282983.1 hypothetical protein [Sphingomonas sanguinis]
MGTGSARWATDYVGRFPTNDTRLVPNSLISSGFQPDYSRLVYRLSATGIDRNSRLLVSATAPVGASIVSPVTSLIDAVGSQSAVRSALQLNSGDYAIPSSVDLTTISGRDPSYGAILAANFRALMLSQAVYVVQRGFGALDYTPFTFQNREGDIGAFIRANPSVGLLTEAGAQQLLRAYGDRSIDNVTYAAMAHLVADYAQAAIAIQSDASQSTRYMLGLQSFFFYRMEQLRTNSATASAVQALTPQVLAQEVAAFADYPGFTASGTMFAGPDFDFLAPGASGSRRRWNQERDGSGQRRTTGYAENDFTFNPTTLAFDSIYTRGGLVSVTVPAQNANQISASMQNSTILYQAAPGFTGTTYFDYVISDENGQQATARFYVIVR